MPEKPYLALCRVVVERTCENDESPGVQTTTTMSVTLDELDAALCWRIACLRDASDSACLKSLNSAAVVPNSNILDPGLSPASCSVVSEDAPVFFPFHRSFWASGGTVVSSQSKLFRSAIVELWRGKSSSDMLLPLNDTVGVGVLGIEDIGTRCIRMRSAASARSPVVLMK